MTTAEELDDIKLYILLPMLLEMIDRWSSYPEITPLKHLHKSQFQQLLDMITLDHVEVKQKLKLADIKVLRDMKLGPSYDYKAYVRGYVETLTFWKGHIKSELSITLGQYVGKLDKSKFIIKPVVEVKEQVVDRSLFVNFD
ncbi:hypothetical protein [Paenibacillus alba]|uniref:Uncharacterized protein n=1 Tax=Paenibacillus alba TaxID=1197127 RepID=A0ABU6GD66_9BACL|nr:hypothetical protein [Paenibacillus alba]MEC0231192.1 hypothetical protein [Paenibacillus alba]